MGNDRAWPRARLIPVYGISSQKEAEMRAVSAVLAVVGAVRDLSIDVFSPLGASRAGKANVETFTEPQFKLKGKTIRPDGVVRITYGRTVWQAFIEAKTGDAELDADQINTYWELARENGFDAVVTVSNELSPAPGVHPTEGLKVRSNSKVKVHHISWTALLTATVMVKVHRGVDDTEQAWLLGELIRYLEHPASGTMAFEDMGPNWTTVRDQTRDGTLQKGDEALRDIAIRWDQLLRFAALKLGARIGEDVIQVFSRAHQDPRRRVAHLVDLLSTPEPLEGTLRVPNVAGDIVLSADIKASRISAALTVPAPEDRGARGRIGWIVGALGDAPSDLLIEAYPKHARTPISAPLAHVREDRDSLLDDDKQPAIRFRLIQLADMGQSRKATKRSPGFIESVTDLIESFYGSVVQNVPIWTPSAPKISRPAATADSGTTELD